MARQTDARWCSTSVKYWKRWIADIQAKTSALTLIERGAYTELLDHYYMENGPISSDHSMLYRICRAFEKHEREAIDRILTMYFHKTDAGRYLNRRAQEEIERADRYSEEQRERSALGVAARRGVKPHKGNGAKAIVADTGDTIERIPMVGGEEFEVRASFVTELERLYPAVDVPATLRQMRGWCIGNPTKLKTPRGIRKFITGWCERDQNGS